MEEAVIITIPLGVTEFEFDDEHCRELESQLGQAVDASESGEYDGNEFGKGVCKLFLYGPSADANLRIVLPILLDKSLPPGSYATKRYGTPGSRHVLVKIVPPPDPLIHA